MLQRLVPFILLRRALAASARPLPALSASALKRSVCGLGNEVPCILDPEILFGRGQQLPATLHPMTSRKSPSEEPQTASIFLSFFTYFFLCRSFCLSLLLSCLVGFGSFLLSSFKSFFRCSFLPAFLCLPFFLPSFLCFSCLSFFFPSFRSSFLSSFLPSFLSFFLSLFISRVVLSSFLPFASSSASLVLSFSLCFLGRKPEKMYKKKPEKSTKQIRYPFPGGFGDG